jgi:NAD(P)-dependent dehydrogenase (short-subunit alcohol dehydrogenase family)
MYWSIMLGFRSLEPSKIRGKTTPRVSSSELIGLANSVQEARSLMDTNFFGPFNLIQTVIPSMRDRKSGTIVNISSAAGFDPRPAMGMYGASKSALEGMSQGLAKEVAPFGIRVLIVQPGAFTTNILNTIPLTKKPLSVGYKDTEVGKLVGLFDGPPGKRSFAAENDVEKGCQAIFEVVTGTGRGEGKGEIFEITVK